MKSIVNKSHGALRVPLPHGKVLHLGLNQTAHVSVHDADHPPLKKLVEEGKVQLLDEEGNEAIPEPGRGDRPF
jgi:hypothetical protein